MMKNISYSYVFYDEQLYILYTDFVNTRLCLQTMALTFSCLLCWELLRAHFYKYPRKPTDRNAVTY